MNYCPKCGCPYDETETVCMLCNSPLPKKSATSKPHTTAASYMEPHLKETTETGRSKKRRIKKGRSYKSAGIVLLLAVLIIVGIIFLRIKDNTGSMITTFLPTVRKSEPKQQIYHLPGDNIPEFEYLEITPHKENSKSVEDLVSTCYSFQIDANGQMIDISCPVIQDRVAEDFNAMVVNYVNSLVGDTKYAVEHEYPAVIYSFHYEAFYEPDDYILTVILYWEADEENRSEVWVLDLSEGRFLEVSECPPRFLGVSYAQFLFGTDSYIVKQFSDKYYEERMADEDSSFYYDAIQANIPAELSNIMNRYVFPVDGTIRLVYDLPILGDQVGSYGFRNITQIESVDNEFLEYLHTIPESEAIADAIFESNVHVRGASDQVHSDLLRILFFENPKEFIHAATLDSEYAANRLLAYASTEERNILSQLCNELLENAETSETDRAILNQIISQIHE